MCWVRLCIIFFFGLTLTTQRSTIESSHSMYASIGDCSSSRRSNSWYTVTGGRTSGNIGFNKWQEANGIFMWHLLRICDLWSRQDWWLEMLRRVFQRRVNLFNLLVSIIKALTLLVVGMIVPQGVVFVGELSVTLCLCLVCKIEVSWSAGTYSG